MSLLSFKFLARLVTPVPSNVAIAAGDRVDAALDKLQGQINAKSVVSCVVLSGTQANSTVTPAVMTGCTFTIPAGKSLTLTANLVATSAAITTGICFGVRVAQAASASANATGSVAITVGQSSAALAPLMDGDIFNVAGGANAYVECVGANTVAGNNPATLQAIIKNNSNNVSTTVTVEFRSEIAASAITAQIGSGAFAIVG